MEIRRRKLPHWYEPGHCYFITIRCAGSLPQRILERYTAQCEVLQETGSSHSELWSSCFQVLDKYLDVGYGFTPFLKTNACTQMESILGEMQYEGFPVRHWAIMPNHVHLLTGELNLESIEDFMTMVKRVKGRSGKWINERLERKGPFWQREWYDHWIRGDHEYQFYREYILQNPVSAGLAAKPEGYPWVR